MTDNAERWRNVAQAAQWLAEGREVEWRTWGGNGWFRYSGVWTDLHAHNEYRLRPEPPKPIEFWSWVSPSGFRYPRGHATREECVECNSAFLGRPAFFREVIE